MARQFRFLTNNPVTVDTIWAWAKQLVTDLNSLSFSNGEGIVPAGSVTTFAGPVAPQGWLLCDGGSYSKFDKPSLFVVIGYTWGGSGDNFNVPDFRDRFLLGAGGLLPLGQKGGSSTIVLLPENLPEKGQGVSAKDLDSLDTIDPAATAAQLVSMKTNKAADTAFAVDTQGKSTPIDILPPAVGVNVIIKA